MLNRGLAERVARLAQPFAQPLQSALLAGRLLDLLGRRRRHLVDHGEVFDHRFRLCRLLARHLLRRGELRRCLGQPLTLLRLEFGA
jgi:hypothetical protein